MSSRLVRYLPGAVLGGILLFVAIGSLCLFGSGGGDDSHITWWVVDELRRTGHVLNLNGDAIEQSSSLGLVLIIAALRMLIPVSTPALGVVVSVAATAATCWMTARVATRFGRSLGIPAALLVATSGPLVYWGTSGMETALAAFSAVWLLDAIGAFFATLSIPHPRQSEKGRSYALLAGSGALFAAVRPENPLLLAGVLVGGGSLCLIARRLSGLAWDRARLQFLATSLIAIAMPALALFAWRHFVFGEWFPHPVAAKASGVIRWSSGWKYLSANTMAFQPAMFALLPIATAGLLIAFLLRKAEVLSAFVVSLVALGALFILASGGDWMSCGRFLGNQLPVWWIAVLACLSVVSKSRARIAVVLSVGLSAANLWFLFGLARSGGTNGYPITAAVKVVPAAQKQYGLQNYSFIELSNKSHLRDALLSEELKRIVAQVRPAKSGTVWLASGQAGAVPYNLFKAFPEGLRFIDFWGLVSAEPMPCIPPRKIRHSSLGVALSPELLFEYRDVVLKDCHVPMADIVFNTSLRSGTKKGLEARGYRVVYFQVGAMPNFAEPSMLRGGTRIDAYIAVRRELADAVHLNYREVRWSLAG